jgi:hypothetical protein
MIIIDVIKITLNTAFVIQSDLKEQFVLITWAKCFEVFVLRIVFETITMFE